jgi:mRNA interferase YafQ
VRLSVFPTSRFEQDVKRAQKRGKDTAKLREVIRLLMTENPLPATYRDHPLGGEWKGYRDCHLEPDWVLIYKIEDATLRLIRTGTQADLFK